jgi:hypothetical protein
MVYSLLVITARNWTVKEGIQDLKIFSAAIAASFNNGFQSGLGSPAAEAGR